MATYTDNYNLIKPDTTDTVDITQINENMDIIDANLGSSEVTVTPAKTEGDAVGTIAIDGTEYTLYATEYTAGDNVTIEDGVISAKDTTYSAATTSAAGLMSAADKTKLNGIAAGADAVAFSRSLTSGTKVGTLTINSTTYDIYGSITKLVG